MGLNFENLYGSNTFGYTELYRAYLVRYSAGQALNTVRHGIRYLALGRILERYIGLVQMSCSYNN
jgi:hypothetical protein